MLFIACATILMQAFCNTHNDFHLEKTDKHILILLVGFAIIFFYFFIVLHYFLLSSSFHGKPMGAVSAFITGNYPRQPAVSSLFVKFVNLLFLVEFISDLIKDISSAKMPDLFAVFMLLIECTFYAFCPFLFLLVGSQRCSMFFLKLLMEQSCPSQMYINLELIASSSIVM